MGRWQEMGTPSHTRPVAIPTHPVQQNDSIVERGSKPIDEMGLQYVDMPESPSDGVNLHVDEMETLPSEAQCSTVGKISKLFRLIMLRSYLIDLFSYSPN